MKGSSSNIGARRMTTICASIEASARKSELTGLDDLVGQLPTAFEQTLQALQNEINKGPLPNNSPYGQPENRRTSQ